MKIAENLKEKDDSGELATVKSYLRWYDWDKKMYKYFVQKRGMSDIPSNYMIRWEKPKYVDPIDDAINSHKCLMYQMRLKETEFDLNSMTIYMDLQNVTLREPANEWVHSSEGIAVRRGAAMLRANFESKIMLINGPCLSRT